MTEPTTKEIIDSHEEDTNHWNEEPIGSQQEWEVEKIREIGILLDRLEALESQLSALKPYTDHDMDCGAYDNGRCYIDKCTCGLQAILDKK
jgi:hypothetical protein